MRPNSEKNNLGEVNKSDFLSLFEFEIVNYEFKEKGVVVASLKKDLHNFFYKLIKKYIKLTVSLRFQ